MDAMITRERIKQDFLVEVIEHGKAIAEGDHKKANKLHKKIQSLYNKARESNHVDLFSELLNENDENVRLWAATFALKISPETAVEALVNLSNLSSITGLSAKTTLDLWKKGMLDLL